MNIFTLNLRFFTSNDQIFFTLNVRFFTSNAQISLNQTYDSNYVAYIGRHANQLRLNLPSFEYHGWDPRGPTKWMDNACQQNTHEFVLRELIDDEDDDEDMELDEDDDVDIEVDIEF